MSYLFFEAEGFWLVVRVVPLSAISFYSALLHKKDAAAIGAMVDTSVPRCKVFCQQLIVFVCNEDGREKRLGSMGV